MIKHLADNNRPADLVSKGQRYLEASKYREVADVFAKATTQQEFINFFRETLDPPDLTRSTVHELILRTRFRGIFTTNFDRVFERQSPSADPILRYPHCFEDANAFRNFGFLAKIHGCVTDPHPNNLVLTTKSYKALLADKTDLGKAYLEMVKSQILAHPILTVGYSLQDPAFRSILDTFRIFKNPPQIFALMYQPKGRGPRGVDIIPFQHPRELRQLFRQLLDIGEKRHPGKTVTLRAAPLPQLTREVKLSARNYYRKWRQDVAAGTSFSPKLGKVNVTTKAWRHITRVGLPPNEICHRLSMLPLGREIIEKSTNYGFRRKLWKGSLHSAEGIFESAYQAPVVVEVIVEKRHERNGTTYTLLSVHERRDSAYEWARGRDLSFDRN